MGVFFRWNPLYEFILISFIYNDVIYIIHRPNVRSIWMGLVYIALQNYTSFSFCFCYVIVVGCCSSPSFLSQRFWFIRFCAIHMMNNNKPLYKLLVTYDYIFYGFENICYSRLLLLLLLLHLLLMDIFGVYNKLHMWLNWT